MAVCNRSTKEEVQEKVCLKKYSLRKRDVTVADVRKTKASAIWLFVSEIYPIEEGAEIPTKMVPLKGFVCAPDGKVLIKKGCTTNIINYLGTCKVIDKKDREKFFLKGMTRYSSMKKRRREPNQANLEKYGIQITATKRFKRSEEITKDKLSGDLRKLLSEEFALAQLKIINEDLQPPNLFKKSSFIAFGQLCMDIGYQIEKNVKVEDLLLGPTQVTRRNNKEYEEIYKIEKELVSKGAKNKSLNIQLDL